MLTVLANFFTKKMHNFQINAMMTSSNSLFPTRISLFLQFDDLNFGEFKFRKRQNAAKNAHTPFSANMD